MTEPAAAGQRVFIYGTLLRGETAHRRMSGARFLGEARTQPGYALVELGWYPGLVREGERSIAGELYAVAPSDLAALDDYEDHPALFLRQPIRLADGSSAEAYLLRPEHAEARQRIDADSWRRR